jgi:hypothetical protein
VERVLRIVHGAGYPVAAGVKRRALRLVVAAEGVIASGESSSRRSDRSDVVDGSRVVTAQARCCWLGATGEAHRFLARGDLSSAGSADLALEQHRGERGRCDGDPDAPDRGDPGVITDGLVEE